MKAAVRSVKNVTKGYSEAQIKVRKATSNDAWGPEGTDMADIAQMTFDSHDFLEVMDMLDRRMNDRGKMWRHVYKALQVFDYCLHSGSENVVRWGKDNLYIIKSLREFQHIDDDGLDQGANIRSKAKELTALLQDDERLRQERANRSNMQNRLNSDRRKNTNLGSPVDGRHPQRRRNTRREDGDEDDEMRRAIEASKRQADEDERKRIAAVGEDDEDIAKAIKLSKEEEELRQSRLQDEKANLLFDDTWDQPAPQPQPVYQQQQQVDFWGNPIDMSAQQQQQQSTGYLQNVYSQPTGFAPQQAGFIPPQPTADAFNTGFNSNNPYAQVQPAYAQSTGFQPTSSLQPLSNNPYAQPQPEPLQPIPTGSNNPFAQFGSNLTQPQSQQRPSFTPSLSTLAEQQSQSQLQSQATPYTQNAPFTSSPSTQSFTPPQKQPTTHQNKLEFLLSQGNPTGLDTFGNTGELRVPAHFNRTGFVNSAGQGLRPSATGYTPQQSNNPFFTGQNAQGGNVRPLTQSATGPAFTQPSPQFGNYGQQNQQGQTGSLIDF